VGITRLLLLQQSCTVLAAPLQLVWWHDASSMCPFILAILLISTSAPWARRKQIPRSQFCLEHSFDSCLCTRGNVCH
jgi:hypothetical protein